MRRDNRQIQAAPWTGRENTAFGQGGCTEFRQDSRVPAGRGEDVTWMRDLGPGVHTRFARFTPRSCLSSLQLGGGGWIRCLVRSWHGIHRTGGSREGSRLVKRAPASENHRTGSGALTFQAPGRALDGREKTAFGQGDRLRRQSGLRRAWEVGAGTFRPLNPPCREP